jgi:hypothetical protein
MIAERISRPGRMRSAHSPATMRSEKRRFGDRFRERLRISSWCLTSTDSAITERAPPGPASRATVFSKCRRRTARSRTARSYKVARSQDTLTNLQFAMLRRQPDLCAETTLLVEPCQLGAHGPCTGKLTVLPEICPPSRTASSKARRAEGSPTRAGLESSRPLSDQADRGGGTA